MSKIAGEINAEMMHPKVIHAQRKELFAEMVRKTGSQQSVMDRMLQEIQFLRDHEGGPMDEEVIDILRGNVASLERQRDELKAALKFARNEVASWGLYATEYFQKKHDLAGSIDRIDAAIAKGEKHAQS